MDKTKDKIKLRGAWSFYFLWQHSGSKAFFFLNDTVTRYRKLVKLYIRALNVQQCHAQEPSQPLN